MTINTPNGFRDKFYRSYFKTQGSRYDSSSLELGDLNNQWIMSKEIIPLLSTNKKSAILELGCGYGSLISLLKKNGYESVKGIDISEEQIQKAKELKISNVFCDDIFAHLKTDNSTYDCILGIDIIEHFNKDEVMELLHLIKERLNHNGKVIFRTPNGDAPFGSTYYFGDFTHEIILNYFSAEQIMLTANYKNVLILPSSVKVRGFFKNILRSMAWQLVRLSCKMILFASGKSTGKTLFTPNLIISARK